LAKNIPKKCQSVGSSAPRAKFGKRSVRPKKSLDFRAIGREFRAKKKQKLAALRQKLGGFFVASPQNLFDFYLILADFCLKNRDFSIFQKKLSTI